MDELLTLPGTFDPIAYPNRLAVPVLLAVALADALVGVVLEMGHSGLNFWMLEVGQ